MKTIMPVEAVAEAADSLLHLIFFLDFISAQEAVVEAMENQVNLGMPAASVEAVAESYPYRQTS